MLRRHIAALNQRLQAWPAFVRLLPSCHPGCRMPRSVRPPITPGDGIRRLFWFRHGLVAHRRSTLCYSVPAGLLLARHM